ncbi:MAG: Gfo/Idh/MocA family oxidoreductase [Chloroflexota bacterium]|nr:MAG: Gfo/Idh/MocA family oxidoreductase [Chloroflexota bacterium]
MSTNETIRAAVIGVGAMGKNHARVYADMPQVSLVGVADTDEGVASELARRHGGQPYTEYRRMLDHEKPDVVTIAVPTVDHLEVASEVIDRGLHLLIEKPIAFSAEEGKQIISAAREAGVTLMIGHIERFNPAVTALKDRLLDGELGRVFQIDARRQGPFPARVKDVGVVIDLAVHDLDVMRYVTGSEVLRVYAETERRIHSTREDLLTGLVRFEESIVGTLSINWLTPTKIRELTVIGERGMFRVDYLTQDLYFFENAKAPAADWPFQVLRGVGEGKMIRHVVAKREPLRLEQEAFVAAVKGDIPVPVSGEDGLMALRLAQAVVSSGLENRVIDVAPNLESAPVHAGYAR